jgi:predicted solute-binding protein|uniref:hypothetical protein n=1 Tax=Pseudomonas sp. TaxID=306 RepID=UPI00159EBA8C|nr:hypothetical protein [Pseudomonas sp.]
MTEPHFIEIDDADDTPLPLPIFVTRQGVDRSHDEAMRKALQADPAYAAELRAVLEAEGAMDELAILDRQLALSARSRPEDDLAPAAG